MSTSMNRRVIKKVRESIIEGFWVACSVDSTNELTNTLMQHNNCEFNTRDITVNDKLLFRINHMNGSIRYNGNLLHIYQGGIEKIRKFCEDLSTESDVYNILKRYFRKYFKNEFENEWHSFKVLLLALSKNYLQYRDRKDIYPDDDNNRCLTIMYPIIQKDTVEMIGYLKNLAYTKNDKIVKDRFMIEN